MKPYGDFAVVLQPFGDPLRIVELDLVFEDQPSFAFFKTDHDELPMHCAARWTLTRVHTENLNGSRSDSKTPLKWFRMTDHLNNYGIFDVETSQLIAALKIGDMLVHTRISYISCRNPHGRK